MDLKTFDPTGANDADTRAAQRLLGVDDDGDFGDESRKALAVWRYLHTSGPHAVKGTSFADPADVAAFLRHKALGESDQVAFKYGDNGVGVWGDDCKQGSGPRCALPPEIWQQHPSPRNAPVAVTYEGRTVLAKLSDTMPHLANIKNGAGIDMNYDLCTALGIKVPAGAQVAWAWA